MSREGLSRFWNYFKQKTLFGFLDEVGPLTPTLEQLIRIWEIVRIEEDVKCFYGCMGRPLKDRKAIARAFVAKSFLKIPTTSAFIERLHVDNTLRRLCGFDRRKDIPSEATFSRAFAEFAKTELGQKTHARLVTETYGDGIVGHSSIDSTSIEAREKPLKKVKIDDSKKDKTLHQRGRPRKGRNTTKPEPSRLDKQSEPGVSLESMLGDLPKPCDIGCKKNSQGFVESWQGYKLHLDVSDTGMPLSAILTSASLHDSQVAIPLMKMTEERTGAVLYQLMDSAYDSPQIENISHELNRIPIIDINPRRDLEKQEAKRQREVLKKLKLPLAESVRFNERTTVERANSRLKDDFGARNLRVRGNCKAMCHLMFGICVLSADVILRLIT